MDGWMDRMILFFLFFSWSLKGNLVVFLPKGKSRKSWVLSFVLCYFLYLNPLQLPISPSRDVVTVFSVLPLFLFLFYYSSLFFYSTINIPAIPKCMCASCYLFFFWSVFPPFLYISLLWDGWEFT